MDNLHTYFVCLNPGPQGLSDAIAYNSSRFFDPRNMSAVRAAERPLNRQWRAHMAAGGWGL